MNERELSCLWEAVESILPRSGSHGIEHTRRVYQICFLLGERLGADLEVLLPAAILHDIGRCREVTSHAEESVRLSEKVLGELGFEEQRIKRIIEAIRAHSFGGDQKPGSLEAEILSDSDKLDAMGAVGIYRAAAYSSEEDRGIDDFINHFHEKLLKLQDLLYTAPAREMALQRREFMVRYLKEIDRELKLEA
jgi:uncharacterized protein